MSELSGSTALVAGASRGMGRAIAIALASAGADVVLAARSAAALDDVRASVEATGRRALAVECDIGDVAAIDRLVDGAYEWSGAIDVLVVAAAIAHASVPPELSMEDWDAVMDVNARGAYFLSQAVGERMHAGDGGSIVYIGSVAAEYSTGPLIAYQVSKAALLQLARGLAHLWAPKVRVNAVSPSFVPTDLNREWLADPEVMRWVVEGTPLGRTGTLEEVNAAVLFLASRRSSFITGQNLKLDGGWTLT